MLPKNTLVMYKGGGYDGCIFEWNYAYIDKEGEFHSIAATGYNGCNTIEKLRAAYKERPQDFDLYRLPGGIKRFVKEAPISHLLGVARFFRDEIFPVVIPVKCEECGRQVDAADAKGDGLQGCGGIAMQYSRIVCEVCSCALEQDDI